MIDVRNIMKVFFPFIAAIIFCIDLHGQAATAVTIRQAAADAFNKGQYEEAYNRFSDLLRQFPKDPLYKYYTGICLVKLERAPSKAAELLEEAAQAGISVKPVPEDVWFWLGRAQQMSGRFTDAVSSYERFMEIAGKKASRVMKVQDHIRQCNDGKGALTDYDQAIIVPKEDAEKTTKKISPVEIGEKMNTGEISQLRQKEFAPPEVDSILSGMLAGKEAETDIKFKETVRENTGDLTASEPEKKIKNDLVKMSVQEPGKTEISPADTIVVKATDISFAERRIPVFSKFEIIENPVFGPGDKIPINPDVPSGLIYRIQVAIFRNPVSISYFKGLTPLQGFRNKGSDLTVYYAGMFRREVNALSALHKVRALGFKDAFMVALMDRKQISIDRARVLEKEWSSRPLFEIEPPTAEKDTVPPTLVFRVEVMRSEKPLPESGVEELRRLAGQRGFDILADEKKQIIYLIGSFLSFKSASEYADLLVRNGYREARVVAYLGFKEIPVDIARKLFEEF